MPEVIRHGNVKPAIAICNKCTCVFSYFDHERHVYTGGGLNPWMAPDKHIYCPECNTEIKVP